MPRFLYGLLFPVKIKCRTVDTLPTDIAHSTSEVSSITTTHAGEKCNKKKLQTWWTREANHHVEGFGIDVCMTKYLAY